MQILNNSPCCFLFDFCIYSSAEFKNPIFKKKTVLKRLWQSNLGCPLLLFECKLKCQPWKVLSFREAKSRFRLGKNNVHMSHSQQMKLRVQHLKTRIQSTFEIWRWQSRFQCSTGMPFHTASWTSNLVSPVKSTLVIPMQEHLGLCLPLLSLGEFP